MNDWERGVWNLTLFISWVGVLFVFSYSLAKIFALLSPKSDHFPGVIFILESDFECFSFSVPRLPYALGTRNQIKVRG